MTLSIGFEINDSRSLTKQGNSIDVSDRGEVVTEVLKLFTVQLKNEIFILCIPKL